MSRFSYQGVAGVVVLIGGLIALHFSTAPVVSTSDSTVPVPVSEPLAIEGFDPSVQRVLQVDGWARILTPEETASIPPTVARTLSEHGAGLTISSGADR